MAKYIICILSLSVFALSACSRGAHMNGKIVETSVSQKNGATALITKGGGGATTNFVYRVYLKDASSPAIYEIARIGGSQPTLTWGKSILTVNIACGIIYDYHNVYSVLDNEGNLVNKINVQLSTTSLCRRR